MTGLDYILEAEPGPMKLRENLRSSSREAGKKLSFVAQKPWEHIYFGKCLLVLPKQTFPGSLHALETGEGTG